MVFVMQYLWLLLSIRIYVSYTKHCRYQNIASKQSKPYFDLWYFPSTNPLHYIFHNWKAVIIGKPTIEISVSWLYLYTIFLTNTRKKSNFQNFARVVDLAPSLVFRLKQYWPHFLIEKKKHFKAIYHHIPRKKNKISVLT